MGNAPDVINTKRKKRRFQTVGYLMVSCTRIKLRLIYRRSEVARRTHHKKWTCRTFIGLCFFLLFSRLCECMQEMREYNEKRIEDSSTEQFVDLPTFFPSPKPPL